MSQGLAFLIWLLCVGISAVLIGYFLKNSLKPVIREGFAVYTCPSGSNEFVTDSGETHCCNGDIVDGYCTGNLRCTLSPKSSSGLPTCNDLAASEAMSEGAAKCPLEMPNYFSDGSRKGCSVSPANSNRSAPSDENQPMCILYPTEALDKVKLDSCYNVLKNSKRDSEFAELQAQANDPTCSAARAAVENVKATSRVAQAAQAAKAVQDASVQAAQAAATIAAAQAVTGSAPGSATRSCGHSNSTGYTLSGTGISGSIPVHSVIDDVNGPSPAKIFLAQNNDRVAVLVQMTDGQTWGNAQMFSIHGTLPQSPIKDIPTLWQWFEPKISSKNAENYTLMKI